MPDETPETSEYTIELPAGEATVLLSDEDAEARGVKAADKPKKSSSTKTTK